MLHLYELLSSSKNLHLSLLIVLVYLQMKAEFYCYVLVLLVIKLHFFCSFRGGLAQVIVLSH